MPADIKAVLRRMADEVEREEVSETLEERFQRLEARAEAGGKVTLAQIIDALESASDDDLERLHGSVLDRLVREVEEEREKKAKKDDPPAPDPQPDPQPDPDPERKTRPGRKQGQAYNWDVDEQGNVRPIGVARIWNEPDEDDEVVIEEVAE